MADARGADMIDFWHKAGVALIIFVLIAPMAYCEAQMGRPTNMNDVHKACIEQHGKWEVGAWSGPKCDWPKAGEK